jgi:hypothetical protein
LFHLSNNLTSGLLDSIDQDLCGHLQKLAGIQSSESSFCSFRFMSPWAWPTKWHLSSFGFQWLPDQSGYTSRRPHINAHKTDWDSHLALGGPLIICLCSSPFSLLPLCPLIVLPDTV